MDTLSDPIARTYDAVPYASKPFPQTHPARLAARARLFGLQPPAIATMRVLELGCASGGNLIPMAMAYPEARFLGVDLSAAQIVDGTDRIRRLGLTNIELRQQSITEVSADDGQFGYIICHGVYSWVPPDIQLAILKISRDRLEDNGVAYVSYNVFPGWRLRGVLRDAMMFHSVSLSSAPAQQIAQARDFLGHLARITDATTPYGQLLRKEAQHLAGFSDDYLFHEFLELNNAPCYVEDFIVRARAAELEYLTDAHLDVTIAENFGEATGQLLRTLSGNALDRMEQYIDFLTGRTFRQTLLVRNSQVPNIVRQLDNRHLEDLHISAPIQLVSAPDALPAVFKGQADRTLTTGSAFTREALLQLAKHAPRTMTPDELALATARSQNRDTATVAEVADVRDALLKMILVGMADATSVAQSYAAAEQEKPYASLLPRADAGDLRGWTSNRQHEVIALSVVAQALLPLCDGTNDREALQKHLATEVAAGHITLLRDNQPITAADDIAAAVREHVAITVAHLATAGLLEAA